VPLSVCSLDIDGSVAISIRIIIIWRASHLSSIVCHSSPFHGLIIIAHQKVAGFCSFAILNGSRPDISKELHEISIGDIPINSDIHCEIIKVRQEIVSLASVTLSDHSFSIHCHHFDHLRAFLAT